MLFKLGACEPEMCAVISGARALLIVRSASSAAAGLLRDGRCDCMTARSKPVPHVLSSKELVRDYCAINPSLFQTSVTFQTQDLRKTHPMMHTSSENSLRSESVARRGQGLLFPPNGYGSLGTFAKFILLTTCWAETRLISRIEFRL